MLSRGRSFTTYWIRPVSISSVRILGNVSLAWRPQYGQWKSEYSVTTTDASGDPMNGQPSSVKPICTAAWPDSADASSAAGSGTAAAGLPVAGAASTC